jgi:hypothetical protein
MVAQTVDVLDTKLDTYLDAVFGNGTGYAALACGTNPYLTKSGRYAFPAGQFRESFYEWPQRSLVFRPPSPVRATAMARRGRGHVLNTTPGGR